ncbi:hypothetical protein LSUE1_G009920 [Lachnellula suecica]|uniref:F-box domain-containing protein n=1 Tax=Lachnellula suecica TaxID=602035 RepID=A0A8T9BWB9_9HELO|nr:hypothetical protein LSUE1_G009920 [Lachnellula suecica]
MATATLTSYLPPELWIKVLKNLNEENDLPALWISYRHVCKTFQDAVESIFIEKHLPKTWLRWNLGDLWDEEDGNVILTVEFEFGNLSEDNSIAFFKGDFEGKYSAKIRHLLQRQISDTTSIPAVIEPSHEIQVHHDLNDTPIPGLQLNPENMQLSVNWRELYTRFYGEEQLYHKGLEKWTSNKDTWKKDLAEQTGKGQIGTMDAVRRAIEAFASGSEESRKIARRARIWRQFRDNGEDWDYEKMGDLEEEERVLKALAQARQMAELTFDSEFDADEGEEGSGSDEEDEDEEWEDASDDDVEEEDSEEDA